MSRTVSLPDDILRKAEELAARQHICVDEVVSAAVDELFAGDEYLRRRSERASVERFQAALDHIPDAEPEPHDQLE